MRTQTLKCLLAGSLLLLCATDAIAQKFHNPYYDARIAAHKVEGLHPGAIVFVGNSITEQGWWQVLIPGHKIENRGIGGDNTYGMIDRMPDILASNPRKIFLMAGINDLTANRPMEEIVANITRMSEMIHERCPKCKLYIQSVLPVNDERLAYPAIKGKNPQVRELNTALEALCANTSWAEFVNIAPLLSNEQGELKLEYTKDGIHLHPEAYQIWVQHLKKQKLLK